jgi:serine protease AprX
MAFGADRGPLSRATRSCGRRRAVALLGVGSTVAAVVLSVGPTVLPAAAQATGLVVVTGPDATAAAAAVARVGGTVVDRLPLIAGVAAQLPPGQLLPPGYVATADHALRVSSAGAEPDVAGPLVTVRAAVGLPAAGTEGIGVTVAVVDTGVADVPELAGRIVDHLDMTDSPGRDGLGHGTFLAGLIGASGAESGGSYRGVAPGAGILDVRVADAAGNTGLIPLLRGLQAVAEHARRDHVRVVSLALSSDSPTRVVDDPLVAALDGLWRSGITVVVPAGNSGPEPGSVSSPGVDPTLLTVGSVDPAGTLQTADDVVPAWSSRGLGGDDLAKPDLAAVGAHVVGLRSPGSVIDSANPSSRVGTAYFRGSGTSMSTAVTAAAVADVLAVRPDLAPDAVKALLTDTTYDAPGLADPDAAGSGGLDVAAATAAAPTAAGAAELDPTGHAGRHQQRVDIDRSDQPGVPADWDRLAAALGSDNRSAADEAWNALDPASRAWASRAWAGLDPASRAWASRAWASRAWASRAWASRAWASQAWAASAWAAYGWDGVPS